MAARCPFCDRRIRMKDVDFERDAARCRGCEREVAFSSLPGVADRPAVRRMMERLGVASGPGAADPAAGTGTSESATSRGASGSPGPRGAMSGASLGERHGAGRTGLAGEIDLARPPAGAWYRDDGVTLEVGATTRSIGLAIFMLLLGAFWCSITGVFVLAGLSSLLSGLGLGSPPGGGGGLGSVGMGLFMLLFCTPFVGIGLWMLWTSVMAMGGREVVTIRGDALEQFSGVAPVGFRKRLSASGVQRVEEDVRVSKTKNGTTTTRTVALYAGGPKPVKFGSMLSDPRRRFVLSALRQVLTPGG